MSRRDPLDRIVALPAGVLVTLIRATEEWAAGAEGVIAHIEATGKWSCDDEQPAPAADAIRLERRLSMLQMALAEAWGALPPSVVRYVNAEDATTTTRAAGDLSAPLTGQAAQDLADLLGGSDDGD